MKKALIFVFAIVLIFHQNLIGEENAHNREIIVMFAPDQVEMKNGLIEGTCDDLDIISPDLEAALRDNGVESIRVAFPDFDSSRTVAYSRTGERYKPVDLSNVYVLRIQSGSDIVTVAKSISDRSEVVYAERNGVAEMLDAVIPNDELFDQQWGLQHLGSPHAGHVDSDIDAPEAWATTTGSSNFTVSVIDNGVDANHIDLQGRVFGDVGYFGHHGTQVAGVIAANTDNVDFLAGVDWHVRINSQNIHGLDDVGICQAITDAVLAGADIINCSWRLYYKNTGDPRYSYTVHSQFIDAYKANCLSVAAMGNTGEYVSNYPAGFETSVMAVGASTEYDNRWEWSDMGDHIDVIAPGRHIAVLLSGDSSSVGFGTSMAAPFVSGIASLLLSADSTLYNDDLVNLIKIAAEHYNEEHWYDYIEDAEYGAGRANADYALKLLNAPYAFDQNEAIAGSEALVELVIDDGIGVFNGVFGLDDGIYIFDLFKVTKTITGYNTMYANAPYVWGRGCGTMGIAPVSSSSGIQFIFGLPYIKITDVTPHGFKAETYVYEVRNAVVGEYEGTYPTEPENVVYAFSTLGISDVAPPAVTVSRPNGSEYYTTGQTIPITWDITDEYPEGVTCTISINYNAGMGLWVVLASDETVDQEGHGSYQYRIPSGNPRTEQHCRIRVIARDSNNHEGLDISDEDFYIEYRQKPNQDPDPNQGGMIPEFNYLQSPSPNPFNPTTSIRFGIKETSPITLSIYDVKGRLIRTFYRNRTMIPGKYCIRWNGTNNNGMRVSSGIYFLVFKAGEFSSIKKLAFIK